MLVECDLIGDGLVDDWRERLTLSFTAQMQSGSMVWFIAEDGSRIAGTSCATVPASSGYIYKKPVATLSGVYVDPAYRGRGIARALTNAAIEWCRNRGCPAVRLIASDAGRPLYESLGFVPGAEMRLSLR